MLSECKHYTVNGVHTRLPINHKTWCLLFLRSSRVDSGKGHVIQCHHWMNATRVKKKTWRPGRRWASKLALWWRSAEVTASSLHTETFFLEKSCLPWKVYNYFNDTVALPNGTLHEKILKTLWKVQMAILGAINSPGSKFKWNYKYLIWNKSLTYTFLL